MIATTERVMHIARTPTHAEELIMRTAVISAVVWATLSLSQTQSR